MFGQRADSQTVCSRLRRNSVLSLCTDSKCVRPLRSHSGRGSRRRGRAVFAIWTRDSPFTLAFSHSWLVTLGRQFSSPTESTPYAKFHRAPKRPISPGKVQLLHTFQSRICTFYEIGLSTRFISFGSQKTILRSKRLALVSRAGPAARRPKTASSIRGRPSRMER